MSRRPRAVLFSAVFFGRENFSVCAAQGGLLHEERGDVLTSFLVKAPFLRGTRAARDRAMTRTIARAVGGGGGDETEDGRRKRRKEEEEDEQRAKFVRRIECAFIWRACMRTYVAERGEGRERSGARGDHQTHGMRASGEIGDYVRGSI